MIILVTGAKGFLGKNLVENLKNIRDGKNNTRPEIIIDEVFEFDMDNTLDELDEYCSKADFVFNLAGVNRPKNPLEYREGNYGFASKLLGYLKKHNNKAPVMLSSSVQATMTGRFGKSEYGLSKKEGEKLFFNYGEETGARILVYRFPNLVGKWIKPNYNSAVGTFCYNIAHDLPITVNDPSVELEMAFAEDVVEEMFNALECKEHRCDYPKPHELIDGKVFDGMTPRWISDGKYCGVPVTYKATLGEVVKLLNEFHEQPDTLIIPSIAPDSFAKKLYSMYLSYLPKEKITIDLKMKVDDRGSFTEILKTTNHGQFSVNISEPGITKGQHWHNSKWEFFIVVSGHGLIQERKIGTDEIIEFEVSGDRIQAVHMLPGYTHNIINLSNTDKLVTLMWANEIFDNKRPDTYYEPV